MEATTSSLPVPRALARVSAVSAWRWRRVLFALYLALAFADAAGKALAASSDFARVVSRVLHPTAAVSVGGRTTRRGNFEIFRAASHHLVGGKDLYAHYP